LFASGKVGAKKNKPWEQPMLGRAATRERCRVLIVCEGSKRANDKDKLWGERLDYDNALSVD
jgi:hypothetical protein